MLTSRILITGATGLIGSHVAALLIERGARVWAIARRSSSRIRAQILGVDTAIEWLDADLTDRAAVRAAVAKARPGIVYHLAAYGVRAWQNDSDAVMQVNVTGGSAVAEAAANEGVRRLVWVGSGFEYGPGQDAPIDESLPLAPANWYAATKLAAWELARYHSRIAKDPFELVTARLFSAYGPTEHVRRLVPYVITQGLIGVPAELSVATQRRDYLHARDAAIALTLLGEAPRLANRTFNIGSGEGASVREVASTIASLLPRPVALRFGAVTPTRSEPKAMVADASALRSLGWTPTFTLEDGLRQTIAWYESHRNLWEQLP